MLIADKLIGHIVPVRFALFAAFALLAFGNAAGADCDQPSMTSPTVALRPESLS